MIKIYARLIPVILCASRCNVAANDNPVPEGKGLASNDKSREYVKRMIGLIAEEKNPVIPAREIVGIV